MPVDIDSLIRAASRGIHVFPVEAGGKRPIMTREGRLQWGDEATTDPGKIRWWWSKAPDANVGVACRPSRLLVIDLDMPKEGKVMPEKFALPGITVGEDVFAQIICDIGVPLIPNPLDTFSVRSPSGGMHYYFRNSRDLPMTQRPLVTGWVDVRANGGKGGYVVGPGSSDSRGGYDVAVRSPIAEAPEWLLRLCARPPEQPSAPRPSGPFEQPRVGSGKGPVDTVRYAQPGNRNFALLWAAQTLAQEGATEVELMADLVPAARDCGLDYQETIATIRSGYRRATGG